MYLDSYVSPLSFWLVVFAAIALFVVAIVAGLLWRREESRVKVLERHRIILQGTLFRAQQAFERYEHIHKVKNTPEGDTKAAANKRLALSCANALEKTDYQMLGPLQQTMVDIREQFDRAFAAERPGRG